VDLNKITITDKFPILVINELLEESGGAQVFQNYTLSRGITKFA